MIMSSIVCSTSWCPHLTADKIDFDVAGRENSFMAVSLEMEDKDEPWFDDDWGTVGDQTLLRV